MTVTTELIIPNELKNTNQWVLHHNKVPYQVNGEKASPTDFSTWTSYENAVNASDDIGFVLNDDDPYTFIDLDDCINGNQIKPEAFTIVKALDSYTEYSQSGTGLHIVIKGEKPGERSKNAEKGVEIYDKDRFMIMTGKHLEGTPTEIENRQDVLTKIYNHYFPEHQKGTGEEYKQSADMSDDEVIDKLRNAKNNHRFIQLFDHGDTSENNYDDSSADMSLCNMIVFYTQDRDQIERIMRRSALYRSKWDRKETKPYLKERTISEALRGIKATYKGNQDNYQLHVNESDNMTMKQLKDALKQRYFEELSRMEDEWEEKGKRGRKPAIISPIRCSIILPEYITFALFDLEENTRLAMYLSEEGIYTRNVTLIKRIISWLEPRLNSNKADEVVYHLTNSADVKEPTVSRYLIPVKNGVFNLETKELEPFNPDYVFTSKISTPYVSNSDYPIMDGWDVESWLESIACRDKEITRLLWQVINDSLNGNYSRKKAIILLGEGNNGKGTFQELITNLIGSKNIATLKVNEFDEEFKLSELEGKTVVIGDDVPSGAYIDDSSKFNSVVTGDRVLVNVKNKPLYSAVFRCGVIQSTNGMPKFKNKTKGTTRRLVIVPFNADFNNSNENTKIKDEYIKNEEVLQYVLHKAINMDFEKFDVPQASLKELEGFKQENDPVYDFKVSVFDEWNISKVPKCIVYDFYKKFCDENGYRHLSNVQFHKQFRGCLETHWDIDASGRFNYEDLIDKLGDLDAMGIGFPDKKVKKRAYARTDIVAF